MKYCPECGKELFTQKFCAECGADISKYTNGGGDSSFNTFDFSSMQAEAQKQLSEQNEREEFYKNAVIEGTTLKKYKGNEESIVIPEGITTIAGCALSDCKAKKITLSSSVSKIEEKGLMLYELERIEVDEKSNYFKSIDGVLYSKDGRTLVQYPQNRGGFYSMPNEVERIDTGALQCVAISSISLSSRLTKIDDCLLWGSRINSISIPSNISSIGKDGFGQCQNLTSITIPGNVVSIGDDAFSCCKALTSVIVSEGVVSIGKDAFFNCTALANVTLPDSLRELGGGAFTQCETLRQISIPRGMSIIQRRAFSCCRQLTSVILPEGITSIEEEAFGHSGLKSIKIPYSVQSINEYAFPYGSSSDKFKFYVPRGRNYGLETYGREFIEY